MNKNTILDLIKGQSVWVGIKQPMLGDGVARAFECTIPHLKVTLHDMFGYKLSSEVQYPRLNVLISGQMSMISLNDTYDKNMYLTRHDCLEGVNAIDTLFCTEEGDERIIDYITDKLGLDRGVKGVTLWQWNEKEGVAESKIFRHFDFDLFDLHLPDGYYSSKEECEKANKKMIDVVVTLENKTCKMSVDENDIAEMLSKIGSVHN